MNKIILLEDKSLKGIQAFTQILEKKFKKTLLKLNPQEDFMVLLNSIKEMSNKNRVVLIALGKYSDFAWQVSMQVTSLEALVIIHPKTLTNYHKAQHLHPCMIIHTPQNPFISQAELTLISRPRPDLAQLISQSNHLQECQREILAFIQQYLAEDKENELVRIIRCSDISNMLPAPNPGAIRVLEDDKVIIGIVIPHHYPPFKHTNPGYKNEIHFVVSGTAMFQHGDKSEKKMIKTGDFVYVKAFEKHEWTEWSPDFKLVFMQWECNDEAT